MLRQILFLFFFTLMPAHADSSTTWRWFSDETRLFQPSLADPREAATRIGFKESSGHTYFEDTLGGHVGIARNDSIEFNLRALVSSELRFMPNSFDLMDADIVGGPALSYRDGNNAYDIYVFHESSHLGADALLDNIGVRTHYSFEAVRLLYGRNLSNLRFYGGIETKVRAEPSRLAGNSTLILGSDWHFLPTLPALFTAFDLQFVQENNFAPNLNWVLGYELGDLNRIVRRQRVFLEVYNGYSQFAEYANEREFHVLFGVGFTL